MVKLKRQQKCGINYWTVFGNSYVCTLQDVCFI